MENNNQSAGPTPRALGSDGMRSPTSSRLSTSGGRLGRKDSDAKKNKKLGHRRVTDQGTVTYKKTPTSEIQRAIQLGISHSIGLLQQKPQRDVLFRDFEVVETVAFPRSGTKTTPAHGLSDFHFRTFAPVAFRSFRDSFQLDIRDFLNSMCSQELRELSNPGASGSIFYISADDEFILKTVQHKEADFLQKLLPEYYMNLVQHTRTLLPKFYGLYCYQCSGKNIRFVVMNNLLPSSITMHERYDLKGSSYKRKANAREMAKGSPTLKDLDFKERHPKGILLEGETYDALMKTIERDCRVLESFRIMDYSLLLGVHNLDQAERDRAARKERSSNGILRDDLGHPSCSPCSDGERELSPSPDEIAGPSGEWQQHRKKQTSSSTTGNLRSSPFLRNAFRAKLGKRLTAFSTAMESIEAKAEPVQLESDEGNTALLGGLPARNSSGDRLFLYIGIIDILQSYRMAKKMEHTVKSAVIDGKTVSVTNPGFYAQRFQETLCSCVFRRTKSLDNSQLLGPSAQRFRSVAHLAMKQNSARRKQMLNSKPPIPLRCSNDLSVVSASNQQNDNMSVVTTWPRRGFVPSPHTFNTSLSYSTFQRPSHGRTAISDGLTPQFTSHSASLPVCHGHCGYSLCGSQSTLFRGHEGRELSWCAQSILSLAMSDEKSDEYSDSDLSDCSSLSNLSRQRSKTEIHELDLELLAVQKMIRRQGAKHRKRASFIDHKLIAASNPNLSLSREPSSCVTARSATPETIRKPNLSVLDSRHRLLSTQSSPKAIDVVKPVVSSDSVESFMQDAEPEFDNGVHFSLGNQTSRRTQRIETQF